MADEAIRILLIEDSPDDARLVREILRDARRPYEIVHETTLDGGLRRLEGGGVAVVLLDMGLPDGVGVSSVEKLVRISPQVAILVLTGLDDEEMAVNAVHAGAQDYLVKGRFEADLLDRALRYAIERKRAVEALRISEERFALALKGTSDGVWDWNLIEDRIYFSRRWAQQVGVSPGDLTGDPEEWLGRIHPEDADGVRLAVRAHVAGMMPHFEREYRLLHADGNYRWMLSRATAVHDGQGSARRMVGAQTDITERKVQDPLTGLPNETLFLDRLERAVRRAMRKADFHYGVCALNLDRFKLVNDGIGHAAGDRLLMEVAERIENTLRISDTVARLSGDEFTVLLEDIRIPKGPTSVARRVQEALASPFRLGGHDVHVTCGIGIALSSSGYTRAEDVLHDAGTALTRAKSLGKGQLQVFDVTMQAQAVEMLRMEADLRRALERGELHLEFQPIVALASGAVVGVEALVRWCHPSRGVIGPSDFVPLLEDGGLIVPAGHWILAEACRQITGWRGAGDGFWVSVNLSINQLTDPDLVQHVEKVLAETGLEPGLLHLEVTETAVAEQPAAMSSMLSNLRSRGVKVAIDDFGAGYSSLARLHQLPCDTLKIDRSLISRLDNERDVTIVRTIVNLAHDLGLGVVAEGVETVEQAQVLKDLHCEHAQGFLYSRPVALEAVQKLLR